MVERQGQAFCLDSLPISDHRFVVTLFSREWGLVKGVLRLASGKGFSKSMMNPLLEVQFAMRGREDQDLLNIQSLERVSCDVAASPSYLQLSLLQCWAQLLALVQPPLQADDRVYRLVEHVRQAGLSTGRAAPLAAAHFYFESWLIRFCGMVPPLRQSAKWHYDERQRALLYDGLQIAQIDVPLEAGDFRLISETYKVKIEEFLGHALEWQVLKRVFALYAELWNQHLSHKLLARRALMDLFSEQLQT